MPFNVCFFCNFFQNVPDIDISSVLSIHSNVVQEALDDPGADWSPSGESLSRAQVVLMDNTPPDFHLHPFGCV